MKIAIAGIGYVGLSLGVLLSQFNEVYAYDIDENKVNMVNNRVSPIKDSEIDNFFANKNLNLTATLDSSLAFKDAKYIIVSTPTNYDSHKNFFDTSSVEDVICKICVLNKDAIIIIKSTIPVGYTESVKEKFKNENIIFSPEFLREGSALHDCLFPSRIIVGENSTRGREFANLLKKSSFNDDVEIKLMGNTEAEAVKLFANTFLAMRVAFFNELDTYAELNKLNTKDIIEGVCLDDRIGFYYNNPSFGYGGYCLPKDSKQLLANYKNVPQNLIKAIVQSNLTRKSHIVSEIVSRNPKCVGIYRLIMKSNSDNFRSSSMQDIIKGLKKQHISMVIFEPTLNSSNYEGIKINNNFDSFCEEADLVITNRFEDRLEKIKEKLYTRDLFKRD